jgi:cation:H+ antiporter
MLDHVVVYVASFFVLWFGAGLIISSADKFSKKLGLSSFVLSFFLLGILTSIPEFAVGITAIAEDKPEVFIGNLIGGIPIIFLLIVPILAILGNGVRLKDGFGSNKLSIAFIVMLAPAFFIIDRQITNIESALMILSYLFLFFIIEKKGGIFDLKNKNLFKIKSYSLFDILKVLAGVALVFVSSHIIVDNTIYIASELNLSIFFVSLIILSLGTNLPEMSLAIKSVFLKKKEIAFGDYVGSGAANTLLFGIFSLLHSSKPIETDSFLKTFMAMGAGLGLFLYFMRSKNDISRKEGLILILFYVGFVILERWFIF